MLEKEIIAKNLDTLFKVSPILHLAPTDKIVVFSDLHMGDGSRKDDFLHNSELVTNVLKNYYLASGFTLILNGDIEELQRFSYEHISTRWKAVYEIFDAFKKEGRLHKIIGNHDYTLILKSNKSSPYKHLDSLILEYKGNSIFLFHGHQASLYYSRHNALIGFVLRYVANPLGIKNYSVAYDSRKQFKIEQRTYAYASSRKIAALIGHTHRPLFESLSKRDFLEYQIEDMVRSFSTVPNTITAEMETKLKAYKEELIAIKSKTGKKQSLRENSLYNEHMLVPCLFNSGCTIGNHGITCIEITYDEMSLVHYYDERIKTGHGQYANEPEKLAGSHYCKVVLNKESMDYIFTKIKFLS